MGVLSKKLSEEIIVRLKRIVPYPIAILDIDGRVVASSEPECIDQVRETANRAVRLEEEILVYKTTPKERNGISFPLWLNRVVSGVFEINGIPADVMALGKMSVNIIQLSVENENFREIEQTRESRLNDFFYQWLNTAPEEWDRRFLSAASFFNVDLDRRRCAVSV